MSVTHRGRTVAPAPEVAPPSAPARRVGRRRWQDPRLWVGILLVAISVLVGARVLAAADNTVPVWRVSQALQPGDAVTAGGLEVAHVRVADTGTLQAYLHADVPLPDGLQVTRALDAGELLPTSAVSAVDVPTARELPLGVTAAGVPPGLRSGDLVDVWAVPAERADAGSSVRVLEAVALAGISESGPSGIASDRQVVVAVPNEVDLGDVLDRLNGATVVLVRVGG